MRKIATNLSIALFVICLSGCRSTKPVEPMEVITSKTWELSSMNGKRAEATYFGNKLPYVAFSKDNKLSGNGGCNGFSGSYNINTEGGINISQLVSTKMACDGGNGETEFFMAMEKANATRTDNNRLVLLNGVEEILVFVPKQ